MSLSRDALMDLMALADGELSGEDLARAERLVAESDEAKRALASMRGNPGIAVGTFVRAEADRRASAADGVADAVMARLGNGTTGAGADVVPLVSISRPRVRRGKSRAPLFAGAAVGALALAAAVTLYVSSQGQGTGPRAPVASVEVPSVDVAPVAAARPVPTQGVEVDEVDSPTHGVSVFEIPGTIGAGAAAKVAGPSSVVIMIEDDPGAAGAK